MKRTFLVACVAAGVAVSFPARAAVSPAADAHALEERLLAPCCWIQTLDVHESELATQLRQEIEQRLLRGEAASAVEDDLATRYGQRIRAVPKGGDPRSLIVMVIAAAMLVSLIAGLFILRKWTHRPPARNPTDRQPADEYDGRLDEELSKLD